MEKLEAYFDTKELLRVVEEAKNIEELAKIKHIQYRVKYKENLMQNGLQESVAEKIALSIEFVISDNETPEYLQSIEKIIALTSQVMANFYKAYSLSFKDEDMIVKQILNDSFLKINL